MNINREYATNEIIPYINFVDLGIYELEKNLIKIANIQIKTPNNAFEESPPRIRKDLESSQQEKIYNYLRDCKNHNVDLAILPELSTTENICKNIKKDFLDSDINFIMGSYYDPRGHNTSPILLEKNLYFQFKNNPSLEEDKYMKRDNKINVFINTPIGDFAVLICYDATDFSILSSIKDFTDFIICIARNKDVGLFDHMFRALTYLKYEYLIFSNDAAYGGSSFYAPFHRDRKLDTLGVNNEGIIYRTLDLDLIDKLRNEHRKDDLFKYPPASAKPRHIPRVPKESRMLQAFQSKSLNYIAKSLRTFAILPRFLSCVNNSEGLSGSYSLKYPNIGIESLMAPDLHPLSGFNNILLKFFLLTLIEQESEYNEDIFLNGSIDDFLEILSKRDKQYALFQINIDIIRKSFAEDQGLFNDILRLYQIDKKENLRKRYFK